MLKKWDCKYVYLTLYYFGHLMRRTDSLEKTLMLGKNKGGRRRDDRGWDDWMASPTQWTWVWASSGHWLWTGNPGMLQSMGSQRVGHNWATELNWCYIYIFFSHYDLLQYIDYNSLSHAVRLCCFSVIFYLFIYFCQGVPIPFIYLFILIYLF